MDRDAGLLRRIIIWGIIRYKQILMYTRLVLLEESIQKYLKCNCRVLSILVFLMPNHCFYVCTLYKKTETGRCVSFESWFFSYNAELR